MINPVHSVSFGVNPHIVLDGEKGAKQVAQTAQTEAKQVAGSVKKYMFNGAELTAEQIKAAQAKALGMAGVGTRVPLG